MPNYRFAKRVLKRGMQHAAANFGPHTRQKNHPRLLILMYHRILPPDDERSLLEEPGMIVTPDTLRLHLQSIREYFQLIHLSDWLSLRNAGKPTPNMACAITFDDGWADNFEFAFPVLQEFQAPATIFLVSDMIGTNKRFWPERMSRILNYISNRDISNLPDTDLSWIRELTSNVQINQKQQLTQHDLSMVIARTKRYSDQEIHDRLDSIVNYLELIDSDQPGSLLNWQQIIEMTSSGLIKTGSHTCQHIRLNDNISDELLKSEIIDSKKTIEANTGATVDTFCFPNGDYSHKALELVKQQYAGAVTTMQGWNTFDTDHFLLQRIGVHQDISYDKTSFLARVSGWM